MHGEECSCVFSLVRLYPKGCYMWICACFFLLFVREFYKMMAPAGGASRGEAEGFSEEGGLHVVSACMGPGAGRASRGSDPLIFLSRPYGALLEVMRQHCCKGPPTLAHRQQTTMPSHACSLALPHDGKQTFRQLCMHAGWTRRLAVRLDQGGGAPTRGEHAVLHGCIRGAGACCDRQPLRARPCPRVRHPLRLTGAHLPTACLRAGLLACIFWSSSGPDSCTSPASEFLLGSGKGSFRVEIT